MAIRERIKKSFRRKSSTSTNKSSSSTSSDASDRSSSIFYQPGETIPYKYRRPVEPAHQQHLDNFSFGEAWRRRSPAMSQYSPMGSRMPSRGPSRQPSFRRGASTMDVHGHSNLTTIESAPISRLTGDSPADDDCGGMPPFSQDEIDAVMQKLSLQGLGKST